MKQAMRLLSVVLMLALLAVGVAAVAAAADEPAVVRTTSFDDLATGVIYETDAEGTDVTGSKTVLPGFELYDKKPGQKYTIVEDGEGNKYLQLTKGTQDPVLTPTASNSGYKLDPAVNSFSVSMGLSIEEGVAIAPYSFRLRSEVRNWETVSRHEFALFAVNASGELIAFGSGTGISLTPDRFTTVTVTVDFGTDSRYAYAQVLIDGAPVAESQLDVRNTKWYAGFTRPATGTAAEEVVPGKSEEEGTWTNLRSEVVCCRWLTGSDRNAAAESVLLFDDIVQYTGVVEPTRGWCTLNLMGGELADGEESTFFYPLEESVTLPVPTREDAEFLGWYTSSDYSGDPVDAVDASLGARVELYALWSGLGSYPMIDFDGLQISSNRINADDSNLYLDLSTKTGNLFELRTEEGNTYLHFENASTTQDGYINLYNVKSSEYLTSGNNAMAFTVSLRRNGETDIVPFTVQLRNYSTGGWRNVVPMMRIEADGSVYTGDNASTGKLFAQLTGEWQIFTVIMDFDTLQMDVLVDGVEAIGNVPFSLPAPDEVNGVPEVTPREWLYSCTGVHFPFARAVGAVDIDNLKLEEINMVEREGYIVTMYDGASVNTVRVKGSYDLPAGPWLDDAGNIVSGSVTVTGDVAYRRVSVELLDGASVRLNDPAGLRFESRLNAALYEALTEAGWSVTVGTYIFPADQYAGAVPEERVFSEISNVSETLAGYEQDGAYTWYTSLVNILDHNYARAFGAVSYIEVSRGEERYTYDTTSTYDEAKNARSVYQVAKAVAEADEWSGYNDAQRAVVEGYLSAVIEIAGGKVVTVANYEAPYTATIEGLTLTVSGVTDGQVKAIIVDGDVYTSGWTLTDGTLTADLAGAGVAFPTQVEDDYIYPDSYEQLYGEEFE